MILPTTHASPLRCLFSPSRMARRSTLAQNVGAAATRLTADSPRELRSVDDAVSQVKGRCRLSHLDQLELDLVRAKMVEQSPALAEQNWN